MRNPIKGTVRHFLDGPDMRRLRKEQRPSKKKDKVKKSNFVRFFESLQERGPLSPGNLYESWTKNIRAEMEAEGTWPTLLQEFDIEIVCEYVRRLQRQVWNTVPTEKWYDYGREGVWDLYDTMQQQFRIMKVIFKKIRSKGLRDRTFHLSLWNQWTPVYATIGSWKRKAGRDDWIRLHPYTPFNDQAADI